MSITNIKQIRIKKDGVYVSIKAMNDGLPLHTWKSDWLSKAYETQGQKGLDRDVLQMLYEEGCQLKGNHPSLERYRYVMENPEARRIYNAYLDRQNQAYAALSDADRDSLYRSETNGARQYRRTCENLEQEMFGEMADLCMEYEELIKDPEVLEHYASIKRWVAEYNHFVSPSKVMTIQDFKQKIDQSGSYEAVKNELQQDIFVRRAKTEKLEKIEFLVDFYNSMVSEENQLDLYEVKDGLDTLESYDCAIQEIGEAIKNVSKEKDVEREL